MGLTNFGSNVVYEVCRRVVAGLPGHERLGGTFASAKSADVSGKKASRLSLTLTQEEVRQWPLQFSDPARGHGVG